jgi:hypothetical protein
LILTIMKTSYYDTPQVAVAVNFKVGSATLARAIIAAHHPDINSVMTTPHGAGNGTAYPAGKSADNMRMHSFCPKLADPKDRPVTLLAVRDPVEKFRSACVESKVSDVDAKLTELETNGFTRDVHFWAQSRLLEGNEIKLYRFPSDLDALATEAGLSLPLPDIDGGNDSGTKPTLTSKQLERVQAIYADDIALYESITEVGQAFAPPALTPTPIPVPHSITAWQAKAGLALTPHPQAGTMLVAAEAALAAMPDGAEKVVVLSAWNNNANFERTSPTILSFGAALGMTSDDLDNLFRLGGSLTV